MSSQRFEFSLRVLTVALLATTCVIGAKLPSFINACHASDADLDECVTRVIAEVGPRFVEGVPELGVLPLDPIHIGDVHINNLGLKMNFAEIILTGLKDFTINSYKIDMEKKKASIDFTSDVMFRANYNVEGQILVLPIKGEGQTRVLLTNLHIVIKYKYEEVPHVDGLLYWNVTDYTFTYKMDRATFKFQNLFGGNKELSEAAHLVLNENWHVVMDDVAPPILQQIIRACVEVVKSFFSIVPKDQLILPRGTTLFHSLEW